MWDSISDIEHRLSYVQVGKWRTRVLTAGNGPKAVVLIAGTSGHIEAYMRNIRELAAEFTVVAYDSPGHGYTTHSHEDLEIPVYVEHLRGLIEVLGLDRPHLIGESLGGWIVAKFAREHRDLMDLGVLCVPGGHMLPRERLNLVRTNSQVAADEPTWDNVKMRLEMVMEHPEQVTDELVLVRQRIYAREGFSESMARILCLQDYDIRYRNRLVDEDLKALDGGLLVWTQGEPAGDREFGRDAAAKMPGGYFLYIDGAAHWPQWEAPQVFNAAVIAYLKGEKNLESKGIEHVG